MFLLPLLAYILVSSLTIIHLQLKSKRNKYKAQFGARKKKLIAFFHPHCSAGGGGERVLWKAIQALGEIYNQGIDMEIVIYTCDDYHETYASDVLKKVENDFSIRVESRLPIQFIHLPKKKDPSAFKRFTLMAESIDTIKLAWYALNQYTPDIFIDTTGCAFTFLVAKLAGCKIVAYVHYPTVSTDMLRLVWEKRPSYNHTTNLSQSSIATYFKLLYYCLFAILYGLTGSLCDMVMVNSTWTYSHISYLWRLAKNRTHVVFPPCNTDALQQLNVNNRENIILSIGQFRPEKDHSLQIRAFAKMKELVMGLPGGPELKLVLVGSCRGKEDEDRVSYLLKLAESLHIENDVVFVLNQPFSVLKDYFSRASIGLHTMWNEHFGIGVVEMMAAGLITIAHNSGGPKSDIVVPFGSEKQRTGFLASTESQYVETLYDAWMIGRDHEKSLPIRLSAQQSSMRFSDHAFLSSFKSLILEFLVQDSR